MGLGAATAPPPFRPARSTPKEDNMSKQTHNMHSFDSCQPPQCKLQQINTDVNTGMGSVSKYPSAPLPRPSAEIRLRFPWCVSSSRFHHAQSHHPPPSPRFPRLPRAFHASSHHPPPHLPPLPPRGFHARTRATRATRAGASMEESTGPSKGHCQPLPGGALAAVSGWKAQTCHGDPHPDPPHLPPHSPAPTHPQAEAQKFD